MSPTTVRLPEASSFILFVPDVAKYNTPDDSVTVQLPKSTVVALRVTKVGLALDVTLWFNAFTSANDVHSLSINAPAAVTLAVSVTSALASIPSNFVPSVDTSLPSTVNDCVSKLPPS